MHRKTLISLFDRSGVWSNPYRRAGWEVLTFDLANGPDEDVFSVLDRVIKLYIEDPEPNVDGLIAAPPCTDFSGSGARWWEGKENQPANYEHHYGWEFDNTIDLSVGLVLATMAIIEYTRPRFWCLENPVGRLNRLVPELQPYGPRYF
jgi:hypothetical protein